MFNNKHDNLRGLLVVVLVVGLLSGFAGGIIAGNISSGLISQIFKSWPQLHGSVGKIGSQNQNLNGAAGQNAATGDPIVDAVKKVRPSVVSVIISKDLPVYNNTTNPFGDIFNFPGFQIQFPQQQQQNQNSGQTEKKEIGGGTGFIVSSDGTILTNKHVVADTTAEYTVITNDGKKYPAKILGTDPFDDLAVLKIDAKNLPVVNLGDSSKLEVGQTVIAIGNALSEFPNTVTRGIISGIGREVTAGDPLGGSESLKGVIQTDAAINPGNSGGPLISLNGEVIGVNTATSQQGQNISFAIPINSAKKVVDSVKKYGKIVRPYLGIRYTPITADIAKENNLSVDYGVIILRGTGKTDLAVIPGSPADKAGLLENDIILEIDGKKIDNKDNDLSSIIGQHQPGDTVTLKVLSKGQEKTISVKLEEYKNN